MSLFDASFPSLSRDVIDLVLEQAADHESARRQLEQLVAEIQVNADDDDNNDADGCADDDNAVAAAAAAINDSSSLFASDLETAVALASDTLSERSLLRRSLAASRDSRCASASQGQPPTRRHSLSVFR